MSPFGKKLRMYRIEAGVSLKKLAESLQVSSSYLSAIERGVKNTPDSLIYRISDHIEFTLEEIEELKSLARKSRKKQVIDYRIFLNNLLYWLQKEEREYEAYLGGIIYDIEKFLEEDEHAKDD